MTNLTSPRLQHVLLDTSVVSAFVNAEMVSKEENAFAQIIDRAHRGLCTIYASTVTREEIDRIPLTYRSSHLRQYETLSQIQSSKTEWIETNSSSSDFGNLVSHPDFLALKAALKDENDARLIYQAKMAGMSHFITLDSKTILNKATVISGLVGIEVQSPTQFLSGTLRSI